jgi:hypothetical protein
MYGRVGCPEADWGEAAECFLPTLISFTAQHHHHIFSPPSKVRHIDVVTRDVNVDAVLYSSNSTPSQTRGIASLSGLLSLHIIFSSQVNNRTRGPRDINPAIRGLCSPVIARSPEAQQYQYSNCGVFSRSTRRTLFPSLQVSSLLPPCVTIHPIPNYERLTTRLSWSHYLAWMFLDSLQSNLQSIL